MDKNWAEREIRQMIREDEIVAVLSGILSVALLLIGIWLGIGTTDWPTMVIGASFFAVIAVLYGAQAVSFRRKLKKVSDR